MADGLTGREWLPLAFVWDLAKHDLETAKTLLGYSYMADDITPLEQKTIVSLFQVARTDPEMASWLVSQPFMEPPFRERDSFAVEAMTLIVSARPETNVLPLLREQSWFTDGIDDDETALLTVMRSLAYINEDYRKALIEKHRIETKSVELPLAGEANLIVVSNKQEVDYDARFAAMEEGARAHELFLQLPFPFTDIILLLSDPSIWHTVGGSFLGSGTSSYIRVHHNVGVRTLYHELGHFYFSGGDNKWMSEGGADFLTTNTVVSLGETTIEERLDKLESSIERDCDENIRESLVDWRRSNCDYRLGERLYWKLYLALGEETAKKGMRAVVLALAEGRVSEEDFYALYKEQVGPEQVEEFNRVYSTYHGGPIPE